MSKVIALFNQAGGVGKTTITQNLGYHLHLKGHRVLLVDLDPQASLTAFMGFEEEFESTVYNLLIPENEDEHVDPIQKNIYGLDLLPADIYLANAEQELIFAELRELRLQQVLTPISADYDFIVIDCPPSLGLLSQISLVAATYLLVPIQCEFKAFRGTDSLLKTIARVRKRLNPNLEIAGFIPTMFAKANSVDNRILKDIQEQLAEVAPVFSPFPRTTSVAKASEWRKPLALSPDKHKATLKLFDQLAIAMEKI